MKAKNILILISTSGLLAVVLGAFGAHGLKPHLDEYHRAIYEKGVSYQFYHTLAALMAYMLYELRQLRYLLTAAVLFLIGIVFFSGSLYLLSTADLTGFPRAVAGPVTPIGGLFFIGGWATLIFAAVKTPKLSDK
jgi:uncharacterized membrane protein YgdD (TMEM256/DUF423 family)